MSESASRRKARRALRRLGFSRVEADRVLDAVRAQREVMTKGLRVEYQDGVYTVTR